MSLSVSCPCPISVSLLHIHIRVCEGVICLVSVSVLHIFVYVCVMCHASVFRVPCHVSYVRVMSWPVSMSVLHIHSVSHVCVPCHVSYVCVMSVSYIYVSCMCPCLPLPKTWRWIKCANNICWDKSKNKMKKVYHFNYGWVYHFILTFQMGKFNLSNLGGDLMPEKSTDAMNMSIVHNK